MLAEIIVVSDAKIKDADVAYLEQHKIHETMAILMRKLLIERPQRPVSFLMDELSKIIVSARFHPNITDVPLILDTLYPRQYCLCANEYPCLANPRKVLARWECRVFL